MFSIFAKIFTEILPPDDSSPRGKKLLYWTGVYFAIVPSLFIFLINCLRQDFSATEVFRKFLQDYFPSLLVAFAVYFALRFLFLRHNSKQSPESRMRSAIRAATSDDADAIAQALKLLEIDEINAWQHSWLSEEVSLRRLPEAQFKEIRQGFLLLRKNKNALDLILSRYPTDQ